MLHAHDGADPQATCRTWSAKAAELGHDGPPVVGIEGRSLRRELARVSEGFQVVVIDSSPRMGVEARAAMLASDLVALPVTPGAADIWPLQETLNMLEEARQVRPELRGVVALDRADRTTLARLTRQAIAELDVEILDATIATRVAFGEATLAGQGVVDYAPDSDAAREVRRMTKALLGAMEAVAA